MFDHNEYQEIVGKAIQEFICIYRNQLRLSKLVLDKIKLLKNNKNREEIFGSCRDVITELDKVNNSFFWEEIMDVKTNENELIKLLHGIREYEYQIAKEEIIKNRLSS